MTRGKVKPQPQIVKEEEEQRHHHHHHNRNPFDSTVEVDIQSSDYDSETISSLAYALRKIRKSVITRTCDSTEIEFIEKRFEDTAKVIFKDLENRNPFLLREVSRKSFRSDIDSTRGQHFPKATSEERVQVPLKKSKKPKQEQIPTIDEIWETTNKSKAFSKMKADKDHNSKQRNGLQLQVQPGKNAVSPESQNQNQGQARNRKGICRIT